MARARRLKVSTKKSPASDLNPAPVTDGSKETLGRLLLAGLLLVAGVWWLSYFLSAAPIRWGLLNLLVTPESLVSTWFGNFSQSLAFSDRITIVLVAAVLLAASYELGRLCLWQLKVADLLTEVERTALSIGVGLNVISLYTLIVGLAGLLQPGWLMVGPIALAAIVTGCRVAIAIKCRWFSRIAGEQQSVSAEGLAFDRSAIALAVVAIAFITIALIGGVLPPSDFDVREYHLQVPKEWWQAGRISFLPHNVYGNMPLGAEMQALAAMSFMPNSDAWWFGALAGKLTMACFVPLTAALLYSAGVRWFSSSAGLWAAAIYVSHPWMVHTSTSGLNEPAVAFYALAALYVLCVSSLRPGVVVLSGFLAGAAAACKYPAVVFVVLPLTTLLFLCPEQPSYAFPSAKQLLFGFVGSLRRARRWCLAGAFTLGVLLGCGPWYAKNAALTGNPVYPLAYVVFGGESRTPEKNARWERAHQVPRTAEGQVYSAAQLLGSLRELFITGRYASPLLLPLLLLAGGLALVRSYGDRQSNALGFDDSWFALCAVCLLFVITAVWWLATHRIERFWLPALPIAALFAAQGITLLHATYVRRSLIALVVVGLVYCAIVDASPMVGDNRWFVSLDALRVDEAPTVSHSRVSLLQRWLNENTEPGKSVLLVGDAAPFDLSPPTYYNTCFDNCLLADWTIGRSKPERQQALNSRNIQFVAVSWSEIGRYLSPGNYGYDPRWTPEVLNELIEQRILIPVVEVSDDGSTMVPARTSIASLVDLRNTIYRVSESESTKRTSQPTSTTARLGR
jgi:hypothetical protein